MRQFGGWILVGVLLLVAAGCGGGSGETVAEGCYQGDAIPAGVRRDLESAADKLYAEIQQGNWDAIYLNAASAVRNSRSSQEFVTPLVQISQSLSIPRGLELEDMIVVHRSPGPGAEVECYRPEDERPTVLLLTEHPVQASLVHLGTVSGDRYYYSSLWHQEEGRWKLAGFFAKPATWLGKDWRAYSDDASAQRIDKNQRNAALLYNLAIDLLVPNAWTRPADLEALRRKQGRISVKNLPLNEIDPWPAPPDTFKVIYVSYAFAPDALGLQVQYQAPAAIADTTAQREYADRLRNFILTVFPEYPRVFSVLSLVAVDPANPRNVWNRTYPLSL